MSLKVYDEKIESINKQISECEGSMREFNILIQEYLNLITNWQEAFNRWTLNKSNYDKWIQKEYDYINATRQKQGWIWHNNVHYDCNTVPSSLNVFGLLDYCSPARNISNNQITTKCKACNYNKCICDVSDELCKSSKCDTYKTISEDAFKLSEEYKNWLINNPKPTDPGPQPVKPPDFSPSVNMVCVSCSQNINFSNITSYDSALNFQQDSINQTMNCLANLNLEKSKIEAEKAAEAERLAAIAKTEAEKQAALAISAEATAASEASAAASANAANAANATTSSKSPIDSRWIYIVIAMFSIILVIIIAIIMSISYKPAIPQYLFPNM